MAVLILFALALGYLLFLGDRINLENFLAVHEELESWLIKNFILGLLVFCFVFIILLSTPLPFGAICAVTAGALFEFGWGMGVALVSSAVGATLGMLLIRYFAGSQLRESLHSRFEREFSALQKNGATVILSLRMLPIVPFFLVNALGGMSSLSVVRFFLATIVGMIPVTALLVAGGQKVSQLASTENVTFITGREILYLGGLVLLVVGGRCFGQKLFSSNVDAV